MSRFVVNPLPNQPTVLLRTGNARARVKITVINNGLTVWFSDDINQLTTLKADGNPGGWPLTGGTSEDSETTWIDGTLYAVTATTAAEIDVSQLVHVQGNASYTSAGVFSDPNFDVSDSVQGYDQPETSAIGSNPLNDALYALFAPLRNLTGGG